MPYDQVLQLASMPSIPGLYAIGAYAKRVTLYSQQCRAINLVDAIHFHGEGLTGKRVAVIGGGAAGLTAAARAASYGVEVVVLEKSASLMGLQRHTKHRWLHPTIYDWPFSARDARDEDAKLPVLNWKAGMANKVAADIEKGFQRERHKHANRLDCRPSTKLVGMVREDDGFTLEMETGLDRVQSREKFQVVLLAVGFGLEPETRFQNSYWEGDPLDNVVREKKCVLIAGHGDGGLTDLMRVCLLDFDHQTALKEIIKLVDESGDLNRIQAIELHPEAKSDAYLTKHYGELNIPIVQQALRRWRNSNRKVVLAGRGPNLFSAGACALNRLIVSQLLKIDAFVHVPFDLTKGIDPKQEKDPILAGIEHKIGQPLETVVLRFGSERVIGDIKAPGMDFAKELKDMEDRWTALPVEQDMTRQRLWDAPLALTQNLHRSCLIFGTPKSVKDLGLVVAAALERQNRNEDIIPVDVSQCIASRESLLITARALCLAPLVIFDLGNKMGQGNEGGMILLGIRSAVRRGVTLAVLSRPITMSDWLQLPFNLKELQVLALPKSHGSVLLERAIEEGTRNLRDDESSYRDLPVFDIVRRTQRRTEPVKEDQTEVLCLCSFNKDHVDDLWPALELMLDRKPKVAGGKLVLRRVTDYSSPLLVGERLYELIRFADHCLIDWSEWRANVFFELGVRMAVHPVAPVCVIETAYAAKGNKALQRLFRPVEYSRAPRKFEPFQAAFQNELARRGGGVRAVDTVYAVVEKNIYLQQEFGGTPSATRLLNEPVSAIGRHLLSSGSVPVLYRENRGMVEQALDAAIESHWIHVLFLRDALKDPGLSAEKKAALKKVLATRISRLRGLLMRSKSAKFTHLRTRLERLNRLPGSLEPSPIPDKAQQAEDLQVFAAEHRVYGHLSEAEKCLRQASDLLVEELEKYRGSGSEVRSSVAAQLADCWGSLGGILRRRGHMPEAIENYAKGKKLEEDEVNQIKSTYNRVQWIVLSILTHPTLLRDPGMQREIQTILASLRKPAVKDAWAWADILLLAVLLSEKPTAEEAFEALKSPSTIDDVYKSGLPVLESLRKVLPEQSGLEWAIEKYKAQLTA